MEVLHTTDTDILHAWVTAPAQVNPLGMYPSRSTQPSTLCGMVKWVSAFGFSNNDGDVVSYYLQAGQRLKSVGLVVQRSEAIWHCSAFIPYHKPGELSQW